MLKLVMALSVLSLSACSIFAEPRSWNFVQAVGGLSIGTPFHIEGGWVLPVHGDVTGLQTITVKPTTLNSGLACKKTAAEVVGNEIYLTIITSLAGKDSGALCPPAFLGQLHSGKYAVFYRGPNELAIKLGEVSIEL